MKSYFKKVSPFLVGQYVEVCKQLRSAIKVSSVECVKRLDARRSELHDEILTQANTHRDDSSFAFWLAEMVEGIEQEEAS